MAEDKERGGSDAGGAPGAGAGADENKLIAERRTKLARLRAAGQAFPNDYRRDALAGELQAAYGERTG